MRDRSGILSEKAIHRNLNLTRYDVFSIFLFPIEVSLFNNLATQKEDIHHANNLRTHLAVAYPALMLVAFFIVPVSIMVTISFFHREPGGFYIPVFDIANYKNLFTALFVRVLIFSLFIAGLIALSIALPLAYFLWRYHVFYARALFALGVSPFILPPVITALGFLSGSPLAFTES